MITQRGEERLRSFAKEAIKKYGWPEAHNHILAYTNGYTDALLVAQAVLIGQPGDTKTKDVFDAVMAITQEQHV